jgi:aminodeoxyfutalosine deaminase
VLLSADWVLPIDGDPIRNGAVRVHNGRIADVGSAETLASVDKIAHCFPGCVILPGFVNAHTHLSLTALGGVLPSTDLPTWIGKLVGMMRALDADDMAASAALGALRCLEAGVTVVGDIAYGPEPLASAADMGVGGTFYWEVLGVDSNRLLPVLEAEEFPTTKSDASSNRAHCGISPHSAYTCGPGLLRAVAEFARRHRYPVAIHVAESWAETELLEAGLGPLAPVAERLAHGFQPPHVSPVAYLASLGALDDALAVHCVHLAPGDGKTLARHARGVAVCPTSNAFLHNGQPPVETLVSSGIRVGIGTDSAASNPAFDLFAEAHAVRGIFPSLTAERVLRMMTLEGADALGLAGSFGSLTRGKQADLVVMRLPSAEDPAETVLTTGGAASVQAVLAAGIWRVRESQPAMPAAAIESAAAKVTEKARRAQT